MGLWLLFSLILHEDRQRWVAQIFVERLRGDLDAISVGGALAHPEIKSHGLVPGLPEFEYSVHGRGCCVTSRLSGESIDVDFYDGSAEWFDDYFYIAYLKSIKHPLFVELRVLALHPTLESLLLSINELVEAGLLHQRGGSKIVRLAPECRLWAGYIEQIQARSFNSGECSRLGKALDDWLLVRDFGAHDQAVSAKVDTYIGRRRQRLMSLFPDPKLRTSTLAALVDLGGDDGRAAIHAVLMDPPGGTTSAALRMIHTRECENWVPQLLSLLDRTNPNGDLPEPYIWLTCAQYILQRDRGNLQVRKAIGDMNRRELGDAAILALEFAPEHAICLFRRALRSTVPNDRMVAAAALMILDQPWGCEELASVLRESDDQRATAECRAALISLPHPQLHAIVAEWKHAIRTSRSQDALFR